MNRCLLIFSLFFNSLTLLPQPKPRHNLVFDSLAKRWDEGIPLGNGWLGALIWQKEEQLRLSLDRADLWDDRPMREIDKLKFSWVVEQVKKGQYDTVQKIGDAPYEKYAAPTKIPGAALEFNLDRTGRVKKVSLDISNGLSVIEFENGTRFNCYIHATKKIGYFGWENTEEDIIPELIIPDYNSITGGNENNIVSGQSLERLGYAKGIVKKGIEDILYHQATWNGSYYEVLVRWKHFPGKKIIGEWTITNNEPASLPELNVLQKEPTHWPSHIDWWNDYWKRSSVTLPDPVLERQYYLDMYKFGCVARSDTPPVSLQAIWTADDGKLPPWKGDFHHDLNTELSYWPGYSGNHLDLTEGFTNWLWQIKNENIKWTNQYFEVDGLNVPGVTTISGKPMGGWIQYSMSPTTSAWLAQHFYLQWKCSMDKRFLREKAFPYLNDVCRYLDNIIYAGDSDLRKLPLSSTPEYNNNSIKAWFPDWTNYDLALVRFAYKTQMKYSEVMGKDEDAKYWLKKWSTLPGFNSDTTGLTIAVNQDLEHSHRHQNHLHAIHPLGLLNFEDSTQRIIIENSLKQIEKLGTRQWVGYSFAWIASIYARAKNGDSAVANLKKFATNFVSSNSFHLNGDQKGREFSDFTYRPFTLEGNFAFAQGIHEMLLQSHQDFIEVFPAVPEAWKNVTFTTLRAEGAFLVSAKKENGIIIEIKINPGTTGVLKLKIPFKKWSVKGIMRSEIVERNGLAEMQLRKGQTVSFRNEVK